MIKTKILVGDSLQRDRTRQHSAFRFLRTLGWSALLIAVSASEVNGQDVAPSPANEVEERTSVDAPSPRKSKIAISVLRDELFAEVDDEKLYADVYRIDDSQRRAAVVLIHGGAWTSGDKWNMADHARELARAGFVAISINYRLAPKFKFPAQIDDCRKALRWVVDQKDKYQIDPDRLGVYGYSAGAHLASLLACDPKEGEPKLLACVAGGAPCDFSEVPPNNRGLAFFLGASPAEKPEVYREASPLNFVSQGDPPFFFFHGTADRLVPIKNARKMAERLEQCEVPVEIAEVKNQGHLLTFIDGTARKKAVEFLKKYLAANE